MKNMQSNKYMRSSYTLRELKKKSDSYFRNIGYIKPNAYNKKKLSYIVNRSYEALPKNYKRFIENDKEIDIDTLLNIITHSIIYNNGPDALYNPSQMLRVYIKQQKTYTHYSQKDFLWKRLKAEDHPLYNKFNTYVYRLGYSARDWFYNNIEMRVDGSILKGEVSLPTKMNGISYKTLYLEWNFSNQELDASME